MFINLLIKASQIIHKVGNLKWSKNIPIIVSLKIFTLFKSLDLKSYDL
jgi:hypothetical protein